MNTRPGDNIGRPRSREYRARRAPPPAHSIDEHGVAPWANISSQGFSCVRHSAERGSLRRCLFAIGERIHMCMTRVSAQRNSRTLLHAVTIHTYHQHDAHPHPRACQRTAVCLTAIRRPARSGRARWSRTHRRAAVPPPRQALSSSGKMHSCTCRTGRCRRPGSGGGCSRSRPSRRPTSS